MAYTVWSLITWVFLPIGGIMAACILSGYERLEQFGIRCSKIKIHLGFIGLTLPAFISCMSTICVLGEWVALARLNRQRAVPFRDPLEFNAAWRAGVWRHQRNCWLSVSCLTLWLIVWRLAALIYAHRQRLASIAVRQESVRGHGTPVNGQGFNNEDKKRN